MSNWNEAPDWNLLSTINGGKEFSAADGLLASDMVRIVENIVYLYKNPGSSLNVVQETGNSETDVMSQKAVTNELDDYIKYAEFTVPKTYISPWGEAITNTAYSPWNSTDYIRIVGTTIKYKLRCGSDFASIAFYDGKKNLISVISREEKGYCEDTIQVPDGAEYYRACRYDNVYQYVKQYSKSSDILSNKKNIAKNASDIAKNEVDNKIYADFSIKNAYINGKGTVTDVAFADITDYIEVNSNDTMLVKLYSNDTSASEISVKIGLVAFYDSSKTLISVFHQTNTTGFYEGEVTIPENASYYRACRWRHGQDVSDNYCFVKLSISDINNKVEKALKTLSSYSEMLGYKYTDSLSKPYIFADKTAVAFGDSITAGVASPNLQITDSYMARFCSGVGLSLDNRAASGSCIADAENTYSIYNRIITYKNSKDFIFISGGTNDFNTGKELGTYGDTEPTTFYGALKSICEDISTRFSDSKVIFITPIPYTKASKFCNTTNSAGYSLNDYRNAIYEAATSYGFDVVDGSNLGMPTEIGGWSNIMCDDTDGCHPTVEGHKLYAKNLEMKLR